MKHPRVQIEAQVGLIGRYVSDVNLPTYLLIVKSHSIPFLECRLARFEPDGCTFDVLQPVGRDLPLFVRPFGPFEFKTSGHFEGEFVKFHHGAPLTFAHVIAPCELLHISIYSFRTPRSVGTYRHHILLHAPQLILVRFKPSLRSELGSIFPVYFGVHVDDGRMGADGGAPREEISADFRAFCWNVADCRLARRRNHTKPLLHHGLSAKVC